MKVASTEIIRAYELKKGDWFIRQGLKYLVLSNKGGRITYGPFSGYGREGTRNEIGNKSQERVELINKP